MTSTKKASSTRVSDWVAESRRTHVNRNKKSISVTVEMAFMPDVAKEDWSDTILMTDNFGTVKARYAERFGLNVKDLYLYQSGVLGVRSHILDTDTPILLDLQDCESVNFYSVFPYYALAGELYEFSVMMFGPPP